MPTLYFPFALTGHYPAFLHPYSEEAEDSSAGSQCLVNPHHRWRKGAFSFPALHSGRNELDLVFQVCYNSRLRFVYFLSYCLVPVCVTAEQRILLSSAAFIIPPDTGELHRPNILRTAGIF